VTLLKGLRGLEINPQVELDGLRDRKVTGLGAATQEAVGIVRGALIKGICISAIGEEKAILSVIRVLVNDAVSPARLRQSPEWRMSGLSVRAVDTAVGNLTSSSAGMRGLGPQYGAKQFMGMQDDGARS
jgi:hypothetical protein